MKCMLDKAIQIACTAHRGQVDKAGEPYILHPLRVMMQCSSVQEKIVAILHDVIEDSPITQVDLANGGFSKEVLNAVDCLSKRKGENYQEFINRVKANDLATKVKIEDIKDNLNLLRLPELTSSDLARLKKYHQAIYELRGKVVSV